jgi:dethiobiotin synthetase
MRGLFVTGTDTGVGKTVLSAALLAAMSGAGEPVGAHKPVLTGLAEPSESDWPRDHVLLGEMAGMTPEEVAPLRFGAAASPHLAAALEGVEISPAKLLASARSAAVDQAGAPRTLLVEGVGGLLVPLAEGYDVRDLAVELDLTLLIAARPGLGTLNHTLLSLEAARTHGLRVAAVVLNQWPEEPGPLERSNLETLRKLGEVELLTLPRLPGPDRGALAAAGDGLPWRRWLDAASAVGHPLN